MKFLTRVSIDNPSGNRFCADPEMSAKMDAIFAEVRPESVYFCVENGIRTLYALVDVAGNHELPRVAEPFWLGLNAKVDFIPAMTKEDFTKAAPHIANSVKKFNWTAKH